MQGIMWGILPVASSLLALFLVLLVPERRRLSDHAGIPSTRATVEPMILREAK